MIGRKWFLKCTNFGTKDILHYKASDTICQRPRNGSYLQNYAVLFMVVPHPQGSHGYLMASTVSCGCPTSLLSAQDRGGAPTGRAEDTGATVGRDTQESTARRLSDDSGRDNTQTPLIHHTLKHFSPIT